MQDGRAPRCVEFHARCLCHQIRRAWDNRHHRRLTRLRSPHHAGYTHDRRSQRATRARGEDVGALLPGVHRLASLAKRWLLGTHQGSIEAAHMGSYLNEFVFRFNRRKSRSRGLVFYRVMELAVDHAPVRYKAIIAKRRPPLVNPRPPGTRGHPPSLDRQSPGRPWRSANRGSRSNSG
jgi:hypothetical protein